MACAGLLCACATELNDPYPMAERGQNIFYGAFIERPKHLDPVQSYSEDEASFLYQIVEPPLQYHYLKRPYVLEPATALEMPRVRRYGRDGRELRADADPAMVTQTVELLIDHLNELTYPAEVAGLSYDIYAHQGGFTLQLSGFSSRLPRLLELILKNRTFGRVDPLRFNIIKFFST